MAEQVGTAEVKHRTHEKNCGLYSQAHTVHMLGRPKKLIQLLFNPEDMVVAIVRSRERSAGRSEIRIPNTSNAAKMMEVYSKMFLKKLRGIPWKSDDNCTYRLTGQNHPSNSVAARIPHEYHAIELNVTKE